MQAFQSSLTQQVEGVAAEVAQLSAVQPLPAASSGSAGNAAAASDQMPASAEAAVSGSAQDPWDAIQNFEDGKQTAYERMQVGRVSVWNISRTTHLLHCGADQNNQHDQNNQNDQRSLGSCPTPTAVAEM